MPTSTMLCSTKSCTLLGTYLCASTVLHYRSTDLLCCTLGTWVQALCSAVQVLSMDQLCCGRAFNGAASIMLLLRLETSIRPLYHHSTTPLSSLMDINHHQHEQHIKTNHSAKFTRADMHLVPSLRLRAGYLLQSCHMSSGALWGHLCAWIFLSCDVFLEYFLLPWTGFQGIRLHEESICLPAHEVELVNLVVT